MTDILYEIWGSVMRNKMRTMATGIAVASGIFLIIVLQGAGNGIMNTFEQNSRSFVFNAIHIWGGITGRAYEGMAKWRRIVLDSRDEDITRSRHATGIESSTCVSSRSGLVVSHGTDYIADATLCGIQPGYQQMAAIRVLRGRPLHRLDVEQRRKVVLVSDKRERELAPHGGSLLNDYVRLDGLYYLVVGIYEDSQMASRTTLYTPFSTLQTVYGKGTSVDEMLVVGRGLDTEQANTEFEDGLRHTLGRIHSFDPTDQQAVWMWNEGRKNEQMAMADRILKTSLWILGLLTLVSGVVGVSNIMLIAVKERTHEFGIRKALGATPWSIIRMLLLESILVTSLFGYIGMLAGVAFCQYMDSTVGNRTLDIGVAQMQYFIHPTVGLSTCLWAALVLVVAGALAGFFPAYRASHVKPIEALHA